MLRRILFMTLAAGVAFSALAADPKAVPAQESASQRKSFQAHRVTAPIAIDGVLDDAAWKDVAPVSMDYETYPADNTPAPVRTLAYLAYDDEKFYIGFKAFDPNPSEIRAHLTDRDNAYDDDAVGITLDTFNDERRAYEFFVSPIGIQMDLVYSDVLSAEYRTWDAIWDAAGKIDADGYTVEMAIPFRALRFRRVVEGQEWGLDLSRIYPRSNRHRIGLHPISRGRYCYLCQESKLNGLQGLEPGRNLEIDPTISARHTAARPATTVPVEGGDLQADVGVSLQWGMTPNLALNTTINPDFSQVEADAIELQENREFTILYPEKRPFFLEGVDSYKTPFDIINTRTMSDPDWGVKLTGKEGKHAIGFFVVGDSVTNVILPGPQRSSLISLDQKTTSSVLRYRYDLGKGSTIGLVATNRIGGDYQSSVAGLDAHIRLTGKDSINTQLLWSSTRYPDDFASAFGQKAGTLTDTALRIRYRRSDKYWKWTTKYDTIGDDYRADVGYMPQVGIRNLIGTIERNWWGKPKDRFNRLFMGVNGDYTDRLSDQQLLRKFGELYGGFAGPMQSYATVTAGGRTRFFRNTIFHEKYGRLDSGMSPTGNLLLTFQAAAGDQVDVENVRGGRVLDLSPGIQTSIGRHVQLSANYTFETLHVDGGRLYRADVLDVRAVYQFTRAAFGRVILQYTDIDRNTDLYVRPVEGRSQTLLPQLLFSYKLSPRSVFFVGYSASHFGSALEPLAEFDRTVFAKVGYAWLY